MRLLSVAFACALLGGCTAPPIPLTADPDLVELSAPLEGEAAKEWNPPSMAVAPVRLAYRGVAPDPENGDTWGRPPLDADALQRDLQRDLRWALLAWDERERLRQPDWPLALGPDDMKRTSLREWTPRNCDAAEQAGAQLVAQLDVEVAQVSFRGRTFMWWVDFVLFWGFGAVPAIAIPDEIYEVELRARFTVLRARTQEVLTSRAYEVSHKETLNDFERGLSVSSIFFTHELFLRPGEEDFGDAFRALAPHALKELRRRILVDLRRELPEQLAQRGRLFEDGGKEEARTFAVLIGEGDPNPHGWSDRADPVSARSDVDELEKLLLASGAVRPADCYTVVEPKAKGSVLDVLRRVGERALACDQVLIYFSGFGTTLAAGDAPALVLDGPPEAPYLTLKEIHDACREFLRPRVLFVFDASFGGPAEGRTFRRPGTDVGGRAPLRGALAALGSTGLRWTAIVAARPDQPARERADGGGVLTFALRRALGGAADGDSDGVVTVGEVQAWLERDVEGQDPQVHPEGFRPNAFSLPVPPR
jgi:hypothetical protein